MAKEFGFCLYDYTTPNEKESTVTFEAADVKVSQSGTEANSTNSPTDDGLCFKLTLTAAETDTAWVHVFIDDDDDVWLPIDIKFDTYGHPLSANPTIGSNVITYGTAVTGGSGTIQLASATSFADDFLKGQTVCITGGVGFGQCRLFTSWTNATDTGTVNEAWGTQPTSGSYYTVYAGNQVFVSVDDDGHVRSDLVEANGDSTPVTNFAADYDGSGYAKTNSTIGLLDNAITAAKIASDADDEIAEAVGDLVVSGNISIACYLALTGAYTAGTWINSGGGGLTTSYSDPATAAVRIVFDRTADGSLGTLVSYTCPDGQTGP